MSSAYLCNDVCDARRQRVVADLCPSLARELHRHPLESTVPEHLRMHALSAAWRERWVHALLGTACSGRGAGKAAKSCSRHQQ